MGVMMGIFGRKKIDASFTDLMEDSNTSQDYSGIKDLADINNAIALRVINKIASYTISNGININFDNSSTEDRYSRWGKKYSLEQKLLDGVRKSLTISSGCMVYFVGGKIDKPIVDIEDINLISTELVEIKESTEKQVYLRNYNNNTVIANTNAGKKVIDPSRYGIINLFPNKEVSFAEKIMPFSDIIEGVLDKSNQILDAESSLIYKSTAHNTKLDSKTNDAYRSALIRIKDNMKNGNLAIMPSKDDIKNFGVSSSMAGIFPVMKDVYSAITGVPKSIIFGEEKSGMNTGEGKKQDHENFMRDIRGYQQLQVKPIVDKFVKVFLRGKDEEYEITFNEPPATSEKEQSDINAIHNKSVVELVTSGILSDEEARDNIKGVTV